MLLKVHVQRRASREVFDVGCSVHLELVHDVEAVVLHHIEVAVVAVARHEVAVFPIPLCVLHAHVLGRNHLAVEEHFLCAILHVVLLHESEHGLHECQIVRIVGDFQSHEFGSLNESVHTDGEILAPHVYVTGVEQRQHTMLLQFLEVLVVC